MEKEKEGLEKSSDKSKGPYVPEKSPENLGNMGQGEWDWLHSSDKPISENE